MSDDFERRLEELLEERANVGSSTHRRVVDSIGVLPDRRRRGPATTLLAAAAVAALAVVALAGVYVTQRPPDVAAPTASASTSPPTPTRQLRPVWAIDLASHLDCDGPPSSIGLGITPESAASSDAASLTPDDAFDAIRRAYPMLPPTGFTPTLIDDHWALQRYLVDGRPKVHVVATDQVAGVAPGDGWRIVGLRTCDPSEF